MEYEKQQQQQQTVQRVLLHHLSKIHRIERKEISYKSNAWSVGKQEWPCHVVYVFRGRREFS